MFKIRDPLGLIEQNPELKKQVDFHNNIVVPVLLGAAALALLLIGVVILVEAFVQG
jgi:hypothetical protein